jgi:hypothetical protein
MPRSGAPQPDTHAASLVEDLRRMSLATYETPAGHPVIPPYGAAPPVGSRSLSLMAGSMPPRTFLYGLNTAAPQYASSVSANMRVYEELLGHHLRFALDLVASTPAFEYQDSAESPGIEHRAIASSRYDPRDQQSHMHPSYYYFGIVDSDSTDDSYDPTRECFHINGAIVSDSEAEAAVGGRNAMPPHVEPPGARDEAQFLGADQGA